LRRAQPGPFSTLKQFLCSKQRSSVVPSNNQLEDAERDGHALHERGIIYVPDFLTNRMGIVNCANEQYGYVNNDQYFERHLGKEWEHSVYQTTMQVLRQTQQQGLEPAKAAIKIADKLARENHPYFWSPWSADYRHACCQSLGSQISTIFSKGKFICNIFET
jgi:hypothetical protein